MIDRRNFLAGLAALATARAAGAQPARKVYRIGILTISGTTANLAGREPQSRSVNAFLRGLREQGYVYGEHFVTEPRGGEGRAERLPDLAAELVRLQVDVIVASGPTGAALKQATSTIPIVLAGVDDPVNQGLV